MRGQYGTTVEDRKSVRREIRENLVDRSRTLVDEHTIWAWSVARSAASWGQALPDSIYGFALLERLRNYQTALVSVGGQS